MSHRYKGAQEAARGAYGTKRLMVPAALTLLLTPTLPPPRPGAMEGFHQSSQQGLEALTAQQEDTKALLRKLANFFGEDPNVAKPDMILGRVADLLDKLS